MKTEVVCVSSTNPKQSYYIFEAFKASVRRFGVEPRILGWREHWGGLMTKPRRFREFLRKGQNEGDVLIVCDAWDVVFAAHPDEIAERWAKKWCLDIVFNAERNCFPCTELTKESFDVVADELAVTTPWRYLNSGFMVGTPQDILVLLESMDLDSIPDDHQLPDRSWFNPNDQDHFQRRFIAIPQSVEMALDYNADICMTGHGTTVDQLDFSEPRIKQNITGTYPMAFHFNGDAKNILQPAVLAHMGL